MSNQYNDLLVSQMTEPLDAERNQALFQRVEMGDTSAREEMIIGNMPLAMAKVESFIRCFPGIAHLRDDLTSAAFTGLVKAVNQMVEGCQIKQPDNWNPTDCIGAWINRELGRLVEDETPIRVPHTSKKRAKTRGRDLNPPTVCNAIPERFEIPSYEKELETRDLIESCCTCDEERTFVVMREAGYTLVEIAATIHRARMFTQRMARRLAARVQHKIEAIRDK
jgi:hypothetical protein